MPTPDASQFTRFRRYAAVAENALTSAGTKISRFNTSYSIPILSANSQSLFLPSINKDNKVSSEHSNISRIVVTENTVDNDYGGDGYVQIHYIGSASIDWGDGIVQILSDQGTDGTTFLHTYQTPGTYTIIIDAKSGGSITTFRASYAGVTNIDVTQCPSLTYLRVNNNSITSLDLSNCPNLDYLRLNSNSLTSLNVSKCTKLTYLRVTDNSITSLDVSKCTELTELSVSYNSLSNIDVSKCKKLETLFTYNNSLTSLDISGLTVLNQLGFGDNPISTIHYEGCGLSNESSITLEQSINELSNANSNPGQIFLDSHQNITYFGGIVATYFVSLLPNWSFIIV